MAVTRPHLRKAIVRKVSGAPADGFCRVNFTHSTTLYNRPIYVNPTGPDTYPNPVPFSAGVVDFYLEEPERLRLVVTPTGGAAQTFDDVDVYPDADTPSGKTVIIPHTFTISGDVRVASADLYYVPPMVLPNIVGQTVRLVGMCYFLRTGGTANFSITEDGAAIGAAWTKDASTTETEVMQNSSFFPTNPPRASLGLVINSIVGTPKNLTVTVYVEYAVA